MYFWNIYNDTSWCAPIQIDAGFQAFSATLLDCVKHLQPGNSVCYFRPFAVMNKPIKVVQAEQMAWLEEELVKLHFQFRYKRAFLWTIGAEPVIHLEREWEDYRVIAAITRVT